MRQQPWKRFMMLPLPPLPLPPLPHPLPVQPSSLLLPLPLLFLLF
jgi:hypothetical protein